MRTTRLSRSPAHRYAANRSVRGRHAGIAHGPTVEELHRLAHILENAARLVTGIPDRDVVAAIEAVSRRSQTDRVKVALGMLANGLLKD